ncbi:hypothetical protein [Agarilytica rhodophyticola]|uniref:hypothetical protein n=1 Tax=Agarilytica rhodophyticola TaxID=1737490 RepID=UPI000B34469F|nr:hypothetical protein [Agarilytica rhodophyticola]
MWLKVWWAFQPLPEATDPWHFGYYAMSDWLEDLSAAVMHEVKEIQTWTAQQADLMTQIHSNSG